MNQSRRAFLRGAMLVGAGVVVGGCLDPDGGDPDGGGGSDAGGDAGAPDCLANGARGQISANHGHTLTVSRADVSAGVEKTYSIKGSAPHDHSVTVTAAEFATLAANGTPAAIQSTLDNAGGDHSHSVTIVCSA